ncbi:MAG: TrmH family RNA methyltransferase [Sandaracinaceae bacterium]
MKRADPKAHVLPSVAPLPAPAEDVVRILGPMITEARMARMNAVLERRTRSLIPVLEDLHDPHNGAAVMRSADAFGCHEVHIIENQNRFMVAHRVTRGTERWLELHRHGAIEPCLAELKARGYKIFIAAMEGTVTPEQLAEVPRAAVVFGNEHLGISEAVRDAADGSYAIPMEGFVESLNVSVASAITLYVASRGRHGSLDETAKEQVRARWLLSTVKDGARIVREASR